MSSPVTILYHADCLDGYAAAYSAWRHFGDQASYRGMHHGEAWELNDIAGHRVFILDFSFPSQTLEQMAGIAASVTQIDHHASARREWAGRLLPDGLGGESFEHPALPLSIRFNLDKSGARLAWEHFHPDTPVPLAILHIEDQDMWRFMLPGTRAFCRAIRLLPFDFEHWHGLIVESSTPESERYRKTIDQGQSIETFFQREVERLARGSLCMTAQLRGEPVDGLQAVRHGQAVICDGGNTWLAVAGQAINANTLFASELGNALAAQSGSFGLIWQLAADGEVKVSLRSQGPTLDVSLIAARYGGGGHPNAAGFRLPAAQFFSEVIRISSSAESRNSGDNPSRFETANKKPA